jgi:hypothetical protein
VFFFHIFDFCRCRCQKLVGFHDKGYDLYSLNNLGVKEKKDVLIKKTNNPSGPKGLRIFYIIFFF